MTYQRQRYQSKERDLEITPGTEACGKAVVVANMGEPNVEKPRALALGDFSSISDFL